MAEQTPHLVYRFSECTLDTAARTLHCGDTQVPLSPKEFHTLVLLVQNSGKAVSREWLINSIWQDTVVGNTSLGRNISVLRRYLGVDAIRSVPKYGYRFVPAVTVVEPKSESSHPPVEVVPNPVGVAAQVMSPSDSLGKALSSTPRGMSRRSIQLMIGALVLFALAGVAARSLMRKKPAVGEAARQWDDEGSFALREGASFEANRAFQQAVVLDPHFTLAHLHLAEAWLQMERRNDAEAELLIASNDEDAAPELSEQQAHYLAAIRAEVVRDYPAAVSQFRTMLEELPASSRPDGLQNLGEALRLAGRIDEAIQCYEQAAKLQPSNAGVNLKLAELLALQRKWDDADLYLQRATELYKASTNLEGLAEVDFERGRTAYVRAQYEQAHDFYSDALDMATRISDDQLRCRALGSLSTVERWQGKLDESSQHASKALEIARLEGSDFHIAGSVMLLANVALARHDAAASKSLLDQAIALARKSKDARQQGNAEFSMATFMEDTGNYQEEIHYAEQAREHYRDYGSVDGVADASILIIHGKAGIGEYNNALAEAQQLLRSSTETGNDLFVEDTEEALGNIYQAEGQNTEALPHFQHSLEIAHKIGSEIPLKSLDVADSLARSGREREAEVLLRSISRADREDVDTKRKYWETAMTVALAAGNFQEARNAATKLRDTTMSPGDQVSALEGIVRSEWAMGDKVAARRDGAALHALSVASGNAFLVSNTDQFLSEWKQR